MPQGEKHRLKYTDSNSNTQVLGVIGADQSDERELDRGKLSHRKNNFDTLKIWTDQDIRDQIPMKLSEFGNAQNGQKEPEIILQSYDGSSWTDRFRCYATSRGAFNDKGDLAIQFLDMGKWLSEKDVKLNPSASAGNVAYDPSDLTSTDIIEVGKELVTVIDNKIDSNNDGYVLDHPPKNNITVPSIERYALSGRAAKGFFELFKKKGWAVKFLHETDSNGRYKIRVEPAGHGGTVDTIVDRSSFTGTETLGVFKEWQKENISEIVNTVQVIGKTTKTDSDGNNYKEKITSNIKTNSSSVSDYGRRFERRKIGYVDSKSEADSIAQDIADKEGQAQEGGSVRAQPRYEGNEANNSFQLKSSNKGVNAAFTCIEQNNFYPGNHSVLKFEFEKKYEQQADDRENLREERAKLIAASDTDVGGQSLSVGTAAAQTSSSSDADTAKAQTSTTGSNDTAKAQTTTSEDKAGGGAVTEDDGTTGSFTSGIGTSFSTIGSISPKADGAGCVIYVNWTKTSSETSSTSHDLEYSVLHDYDNDGTKEEILTSQGETGKKPKQEIYEETDKFILGSHTLVSSYPIIGGNDITVKVRTVSGTTHPADIEAQIKVFGQHIHNATTSDSGHGSSGDPSEHAWSGTTSDAGHGDENDPSTHQINTSTSDSGHGSSSDPSEHGGNAVSDTIKIVRDIVDGMRDLF